MKSTLYNENYVNTVQNNIQKYEWAKKLRDEAIEKARFWHDKSDDELWSLMFGSTLKRSYTVRTDGICTQCGASVPMQTWIVDAKKHPWKVQCPHCKTFFPKNDFYAYYKSGLDESGVFQYDIADQTLLTCDNIPGDIESTYRTGIDDGEGAIEGWCKQKRWYYIAHYLVNGQWKQLIVDGIQNLAAAYLLTGETVYAHKAGIMLDRVADLLPTFNYHRQGLVYEMPGDSGYVSTWHNSNSELRPIVLAYDMIFNAIKDDDSLVDFLREKSKKYKVINKKECFLDIKNNIETRILRDILKNPRKVTLNFPGTDILLIMVNLILGTDETIACAIQKSEEVFKTATEIDGVTGERGIGGYAGFTTDLIFQLLEVMAMFDSNVVGEVMKKYPDIEKSFRFFTDIYFLDKYYPNVGDTGYFASTQTYFSGVNFVSRIGGEVTPGFNMFTLLWKIYKITNNEYYLEIIKKMSKKCEIICDIGDENTDIIIEAAKTATEFSPQKSLNLKKWQLATLVAGKGEDERALWIHYLPFTERHGHMDTMNIGLFAHGIDLMPDAGYPPIQYGGWFTDNVRWYKSQWMHNLVLVDRNEKTATVFDKDYPTFKRSATKLWHDSEKIHAITVSAENYKETSLYERTLCMIDIDEKNSIILDVFRVVGGHEHIKMMHSTYGNMKIFGFNADDSLEFPSSCLFGDVVGEKNVSQEICGADWTIEDKYHVNTSERSIHLAYYDLTDERGMYKTTLWINGGPNTIKNESNVPALMTIRKSENELESCFESIIVPYENENPVDSVKKTNKLTYEIKLKSGKTIKAKLIFNNETSIELETEGEIVNV